MEAYRHILSWCRHSKIGVFFFPLMFLVFSVTPSFTLVTRELWRFFISRTVINFHAAVIFVQDKEVSLGLIEVYYRVEGV